MDDQAFPQKTRLFWQWFGTNAARLHRLRSPRARLFQELESKLKHVREQLEVEISGSPGSGQMDLIISAGGQQQLFALVDTLVNAAPRIPGWTIHALRPALGDDAEIDYEGIRLSTTDLYFRVLGSKAARPMQIELSITGDVPGSESAREGALLLTESTVGERAAATVLEIVEVVFRDTRDLPPESRLIRKLVQLIAH